MLALRVFGIPLEFNHSNSLPFQKTKDTEISWQITPEDPQLPNRMKFLEANPDVPENAPDKTSNFSFQDQQAAQLDARAKATEQTPRLDGEKETVKIVSPPKELIQQSSPEPPTSFPQVTSGSVQKKTPAPDYSTPTISKIDSKSENGQGIKLSKSIEEGKDQRIINLSKEESSGGKEFTYKEVPRVASPHPTPRARPRLSPDLLTGPLMKTQTTAPRIGTIAIECRLHPYGVYLQEMLQAIEEQWHQLAKGSMRYLKFGQLPPKITYRFTLLASGSIQAMQRLDTEENGLPAELCRQAIASRVPFGEWTDRMIQDFGKSDQITISFSYK